MVDLVHGAKSKHIFGFSKCGKEMMKSIASISHSQKYFEVVGTVFFLSLHNSLQQINQLLAMNIEHCYFEYIYLEPVTRETKTKFPIIHMLILCVSKSNWPCCQESTDRINIKQYGVGTTTCVCHSLFIQSF